VTIGGKLHVAVQVPPPVRTSRVHATPSLHVVGQRPGPARMAVSQVSPGSTMPLPHPGRQSLSVAEVAPGGQQPSPERGVVIGVKAQAAVQVPGLASASVVQTMPSVQTVGHRPGPAVIARSQVSPGSRVPLPQVGWQSSSVAGVAPGGQQPSPSTGAVIGVAVHIAAQVPAPTRASAVQLRPSLQVSGHAPAPLAMPGSHSSPGSRTPLPQTTPQSGSVRLVAPVGQQPSPAIGVVIAACSHAT
jgi:hypothetical protein